MCFSHLNINPQFYLYIYFTIGFYNNPLNQGLKSVCNPAQYEKPLGEQCDALNSVFQLLLQP